jgi:hypothetical protein
MENRSNIIRTSIFLCILISFLGFGSSLENAVISGVTYDAERPWRLSGTTVVASCDHHGLITTEETVSGAHGIYKIVFDNSKTSTCLLFDEVTLTATNDDISGVETINMARYEENYDFFLLHIPMTPEFGFYMGLLTLVSGIGMFFLVRKD